MANDHDRAAAPQVNANQPVSRQVPPESLIELVLLTGGGYIPERGSFSPKVWGQLLGKSYDTVMRYVEDLDIPHMKHGDLMLIDRDDLVAALPKRRPSEIRADKAKGSGKN